MEINWIFAIVFGLAAVVVTVLVVVTVRAAGREIRPLPQAVYNVPAPTPGTCLPGEGTTWLTMGKIGDGGIGCNYLTPAGFVNCDYLSNQLGDPIEENDPPPDLTEPFILCYPFESSGPSYDQVRDQLLTLNPPVGTVFCVAIPPNPVPTDELYAIEDARFYYVNSEGTLVESTGRVTAIISNPSTGDCPAPEDAVSTLSLDSVPRFSFFYCKSPTEDVMNPFVKSVQVLV